MINKVKPTFKFGVALEDRCIDFLRSHHRGKENAIPHKLLATRINVNPRKTRALVSHLVRNCYIPIGTTSDSGYFFIANKKEMKIAHDELMSRSGMIINRAFALKQAFRKYYENIKNPKLFYIKKERL